MTSKPILATVAALTCAAAVTAVAAPASAAAVTPTHPARGSVVGVTPLQHLSAADVAATLRDDSFDTSQVRYGVDAYRIV